MALGDMLERRSLILVTGKGGTGKSTLVAALAELAAKRRGRALALELAIAPRLEGLVHDPRVEVATLELEDATANALTRMLGLPALVSAITRNRVIRQFVRTSPAARETIYLDEVRHRVEHCSREGIPVIVDLPATGHALSFLHTPRTVRELLRVGPVAAAAERIESLLLDPSRCELVVAALPEELPINETIELVRRAGEIGLATRRVIVNQVPQEFFAEGDRPLLELFGTHGEGAVGGFARTALGDLDAANQARLLVERLRRSVPVQVLEIPLCRGRQPRACVEAMIEGLSR